MALLPEEYTRLYWDAVLIIESLSDQPAYNLYKDKLRYQGENLNYSARYVHVTAKSELIELLLVVLSEAKKGRRPILHFEMHGNPKGLVLQSGELIGWYELGDILREINIAMNNALVVVLAACFGIELYSAIEVWRRAPFRYVIAPIETVSFGLIEEGFDAFYDALPESIMAALVALNKDLSNPSFWLVDVEKTFHQFFEECRQLLNTVAKVNERVDLIAELKGFKEKVNVDYFRHSLTSMMLGGDKEKEEAYRFFMMLELIK